MLVRLRLMRVAALGLLFTLVQRGGSPRSAAHGRDTHLRGRRSLPRPCAPRALVKRTLSLEPRVRLVRRPFVHTRGRPPSLGRASSAALGDLMRGMPPTR